MADGSDTDADALRRLEERLDRAAAAAERLLSDAVLAADGAGGSGDAGGSGGAGGGPPNVPPAGWQQPAGGSDARGGWGGGEIELLLGVLASLRDRIPPELQHRLADAVREVLLAVRALIDWYLERSERRRAQPREVQDIPIL